MKKVIILNGSPRKNFNTAQLLKDLERAFDMGKRLAEMQG
jgi:multimeric flavodoxin WrbA